MKIIINCTSQFTGKKMSSRVVACSRSNELIFGKALNLHGQETLVKVECLRLCAIKGFCASPALLEKLYTYRSGGETNLPFKFGPDLPSDTQQNAAEVIALALTQHWL
jgi:hypothetical protein